MIIQRKALLLFMSMVPCSVWSAPALQMHVFEDDAVIIESAQPLKLHVYSQTNSVYPSSSKYPSQSTPTNVGISYKNANVYLRSGYRKDKLVWNIANIGGAPNILSELTWEDIEIATLNFGASYELTNDWLLNFDAVYGRIFNGDNQDSDYLGNNRTQEFSRSNNSAEDGDVYDISLSAAYTLNVNKSVEFQPEIGISYHAQNFMMTDGYQTVSEFGFTNPVGPFSGLNSTYDATWFGPWVGVNTLIKPSEELTFNFGVEYHYVSYDATANWNLRSDFAHPESFTHEADGYGWVTRFEGIYKYSPQLSFDLALNYQEWIANKNGKDTTYFSDGTVVDDIPFNEAKWRTYGLSIGVNYDF
jgi:hypothetical protein